MLKYIIRRENTVTPELLSALQHLLPQLTNAEIPGAEEVQKILDSGSFLITAYSSDNEHLIIGSGTLALYRTPSGLHGHIEDVIVDEKFRGKGIGELLVNELLQIARETGLAGLSLTCNPRRTEANKLYCKMGFTEWKTNTYWYNLSE